MIWWGYTMSTHKKIQKIQFKNFRSYKDEVFEIDTNSKLILIYGGNGLGKTAFFDGIEWGLTGSLKRYDRIDKEKNEYPILGNIFKNANEKSYVNIQFNDNSYITREIKKKGDSDFNEGIITNDVDINMNLVNSSYREYIKFNDNFSFSQFLSQDLINTFIRSTKDTDRYNSLVDLFGLGRYNQYNPFFKNIIISTNKRKKLIQEKINKLIEDINNETNKVVEVNIDSKIKEEEINSLLDKRIDFTNNQYIIEKLESIKIDYIEHNNIKHSSIYALKSILEELEYISYSFNKNETSIKELEDFKSRKETYENYIRLLNMYNKSKYVVDNIQSFNKYKKNINKISTSKENYNEKLNLLNQLNDKNKLLDEKIAILTEGFKARNDLIENYYKLKSQIIVNEKNIIELKEKIKERASMKEEFLNVAINYLNKNLLITECPMCTSAFNVNDTIKALTNEIDAKSDITFIDLKLKIDQLEELIMNRKTEISNIEESIIYYIESFINNYYERLERIKQKIDKFDIHKKIALEVNKILIDLDLEIKDASLFYNNISQTINDMKIEINVDKYVYRCEELGKKINLLDESLKKYIGLKKKYDIKYQRDIILNTEFYNNKMLNYEIEINNGNNIIRLCNELVIYYNSYFSKNNLIILHKKLEEYKKHLASLAYIEDTYDKLLQNNRNVIEKETEQMLLVYQETIQKIYKYLNPNLKFDEFNIRIDNTNPRNNRMILEVIGLNGSKMSPAYSFSSAQSNVLAISLFLSFALTQNWSNLDCIFMDDPIQNMDDINIHNFVDILRNIIKNTDKQIFISTHDERIFKFMKNKFHNCIQSFELQDYGILG